LEPPISTVNAPQKLRALADLPGPPGIPLLGNLLQIEAARMHQQFEA
jgi:hypothetical protein